MLFNYGRALIPVLKRLRQPVISAAEASTRHYEYIIVGAGSAVGTSTVGCGNQGVCQQQRDGVEQRRPESDGERLVRENGV